MNRSLLISLAGGLVVASIFATLPDEAVGMSTWLVAIIIVGVAGAAAHRFGGDAGSRTAVAVIEALEEAANGQFHRSIAGSGALATATSSALGAFSKLSTTSWIPHIRLKASVRWVAFRKNLTSVVDRASAQALTRAKRRKQLIRVFNRFRVLPTPPKAFDGSQSIQRGCDHCSVGCRRCDTANQIVAKLGTLGRIGNVIKLITSVLSKPTSCSERDHRGGEQAKQVKALRLLRPS